MKKLNFKKRNIQFFLIMFIFCIFLFTSTKTYAATTKKNREDLITNISNPSSAILSFYIKIPAGNTVTYKVELIPNKRVGSINTISGSYKNNGKSEIKKKITVTTRYYSNKYKISASYSTGNARNKVIYNDEDNATSALKKTVYTNKFVWNNTNIKKWNRLQKVPIVFTFATTGVVDCFVTKGYLSGTVATVLSVTLFVGDMYAPASVADTKTIQVTPIKGWGYRIKLVPYSGGFRSYLLVYDAKGKLYETVNLGKISTSTIVPAVR